MPPKATDPVVVFKAEKKKMCVCVCCLRLPVSVGFKRNKQERRRFWCSSLFGLPPRAGSHRFAALQFEGSMSKTATCSCPTLEKRLMRISTVGSTNRPAKVGDLKNGV